jgi:hypothetical protein
VVDFDDDGFGWVVVELHQVEGGGFVEVLLVDGGGGGGDVVQSVMVMVVGRVTVNV